MVRPQADNTLRIDVRKWYSAHQLIAAGWEQCCADKLAYRLLAWHGHGVRTRIPDRRKLDHELTYSDVERRAMTEFRFTSRNQAKKVRKAMRMAEVRGMLGDPAYHPGNAYHPRGIQSWAYRCACEDKEFRL